MRRYLRIALPVILIGGMLWTGFEGSIRRAHIPQALSTPPPATTVLLDMREQAFARPGDDILRDARPVSLHDMGPWLPMVTVGIEDHRFWKHHGVDWHATFSAALQNIFSFRIISGASTITQQTIKITSGRTERTFRAKLREAFAALKLERTWDKKKILETYLNRIDYGNRRIGAEAAAQAYFGKNIASLSLSEAIFLAGLPQSPSRLNPWRNSDQAFARYRRNVLRLEEIGVLPNGITSSQLLATMPKVEMHNPPVQAVHFAMLAMQRAKVGADTLRTTLDPNLQHIAETLLNEHLRVSGPMGVGDAAIVVVENSTGAVRALASAGRADHRDINAAIVPRSCGSTLKPFIYLSAIEQKLLTAATLMPDTDQAIPSAYHDYDPQNYSHRFHGPVRVREALGNSFNVPAVVAVSRLGARNAFNELRRWGFQFSGSFDDYGAGFILGNADIRLVDLAGAYAGLARGGVAWNARLLHNEAIESERIASPEACAIVTDMLCDNEARKLSFGLNSPLNLGARVAVKTGTSSGFRDRWCVGFDQKHTVAVWAGNLDGKSLGEVLAVGAAAPLWAGMMRYLLEHGDTSLPVPEASKKLHALQVAAETGLLPRAGEPIVQEWFLSGTEPARNAAEMYEKIDGRDTLVLPPEYAGWCASTQNRLAAIVHDETLEIIFPKDGASFDMNSHLPKSQQMIHLKASQSGCRWMVNGKEVGELLPLQPGEWSITASKGDVIAKSKFSVSKPDF
ncbi:MAG: transglycosylase domain-containing protein [Chthoniobacterales bacterium]